jgi:hypothetical protein
MTRANKTRGESGIVLDGVSYVLRPSFEALEAIEDETGKGLGRLLAEATRGDLTVKATATVITECIRAQGRATGDDGMAKVNTDKIGKLMMTMDGGYVAALGIIIDLISTALTGGYSVEGEVVAPTGTAKKAPAGA